MNAILKFPLSIKVPLLLVGAYLFFSILYIGQDLILPLIYAAIIAILIAPAVNYLVRKKIHRALAISIVLLITFFILVSLTILIISRASVLVEALPQLTKKLTELMDQLAKWTSEHLNIRRGVINTWITESKADLLSNSNAAIGLTVTTMGGMLTSLFLTPVYIFMILLYQPHLVEFLYKLFASGNNAKVDKIITMVNTIVKDYLVGLSFEFLIVAALNSIGLFILGIEYAILLGVMGALLNIIPYLGGAIAVLLYMLVALVTRTPEYVAYVAVLYGIIQFIDNNYIIPKIVGSMVKLNALLSIIVVVLGGAIWGIPGMFLSIPITAILKLVLDHTEPLKPWGFLLGEPISSPLNIKKAKSAKS